MANSIFTTDKILEKIFSFMDLATAKKMKLVSGSFSKNFRGCQGNIYLKLKDADQIYSEVENERILEWALKSENSWTLKGLKIPIIEAMRSYVVQNFLKLHGHQATHLHLFRQINETYDINIDFRPVLCSPPAVLLCNVLSKWCPNLKHLSIQDNFYDPSDINIQLGIPFSETKLKSLELIGCERATSKITIMKGLHQTALVELILNSPKLIELKISHASDDWLLHGINQQGFKSNLEVIELATLSFKWDSIRQLKFLSEQRFPRLKKLSMRADLDNCFIGDHFKLIYYLPLKPVHAGVKELCFSSNHPLYIAVLLTLFPNVEYLKITHTSRYREGSLDLERSFPSVKKLSVGFMAFLDATMIENCKTVRPPVHTAALQIWLEWMPALEKLEITEPVHPKRILQVIDAVESLKELEVRIGPRFNMKDLEIFPDNLRLIIRQL